MYMYNILTDMWSSQPSKLSLDGFKFFANFTSDITKLHTGVPTLILGYNLAKKTMGDIVHPTNHKINEHYYWCKEDDREYVNEFIESSISKFLDHLDHGIDPVFEEFDFDYFVENLNDYPLVHNGKYEIYVVEDRSGTIIIHSVKKDALKYAGFDPTSMYIDIVDQLEGKCLMVTTDEYPMTHDDFNQPLFISDLIESYSGEIVSIKKLVDSFSPRYMTKAELLTFLLLKIKHLRGSFPLYSRLEE